METSPRVELLWWEGCPNTDEALALLRQEMESLGLDPGTVDMRQVATDAAAHQEKFVGSPTIRVNGRDIQPPGGEPTGLTCRVYRLRDGRISPLPDRMTVREAIEAAMTGGDE
jgi:hypothetical protein